MPNTTITVPDELLERLRLIASERGIPVEMLVREALEDKAQQSQPRPQPIGIASSGHLEQPICCRPYHGIDMIEIPRIAAALDRWGDRFLHRIYTEGERARYRNRIPELAARFAAKEAVMKALGTGVRGVGWRDIEVLPDPRGKPLVTLYGRGLARAQLLGIQVWEISLTHSKEYSIASVVALAHNNTSQENL